MNKLPLPPTIWILSIIIMSTLHIFFPIFYIELEIWRTTLGLGIFLSAVTCTLWHKHLFQVEKTNIHTFEEPDKLIELGLFKYIRNPMYLGFLASLVALAIIGGSLSPWLIVLGFYLIANHIYIPFEEKQMKAQFGKQYEDYIGRTRRWL